MFRDRSVRVVTSTLLALLLVIGSIPVSAADFPRSNLALGSVRAAGAVQVRGVAVSKESTVFSGDRVHTGSKSYAKVTLVNGNRFELLNDTDLVVDRNNQEIKVGLAAGAVAFNASKTPIAIRVAEYEIRPAAGSSGVVGFVGNEIAAVRAISGTVTLTSLKDNKNTVIAAGVDRFMDVSARQSKTPLTQLASTGPTSLPSAAAALPQGGPQAPGLSTAAWAGIVAAVVGGIIIVAVLATGDDDASPSRP